MADERFFKVSENVKGLIFDCDGTLIDSMPLHMKAWEYAIIQVGGVWDYDFFFSKKGMRGKDIVELYNQQNLTPLNSIAVAKTKNTYFRNHRDEFKPIKPVIDIVLRYKGILPMALHREVQEKTCTLNWKPLELKNASKLFFPQMTI